MKYIALMVLMPLACWAGDNTSLAMAPSRMIRATMVEPHPQDGVVSAILRMEERNSAFRNLSLEADVVVERRGKESVSLSAQYAASGADYRFRINWGSFDVLDLSVKGKEATLWLPRKGTWCKGDRSYMADIPNDLRFVGLAGDARGLILPSCWASGADKRKVQVSGGKTFVNVIRGGELMRRFAIGFVDGEAVIEKVVFLEGGRPTSAIAYSGHSLVSGMYLPSRVDFYPSEATTLSMTVKKAKANADKPPRLDPYIPEDKLADAPQPLDRVLAVGLFE